MPDFDALDGMPLDGAPDLVTITGNITENADTVAGALSAVVEVIGSIQENADTVAGSLTAVVEINGAIQENQDVMAGTIIGTGHSHIPRRFLSRHLVSNRRSR